jgi:uncharacterized protein
MANSEKAFLGVGWAFPLRIDADGKIAMAELEEDVRQAIRIILGTNPGERSMRPDFGAGLSAFAFEPVNAATLAWVKTRVEEALIDAESRIDVEDVRVTSGPAEGRGNSNSSGGGNSALLIEVRYRVRATNSQHNLVYPFYLEGIRGGL